MVPHTTQYTTISQWPIARVGVGVNATTVGLISLAASEMFMIQVQISEVV